MDYVKMNPGDKVKLIRELPDGYKSINKDEAIGWPVVGETYICVETPMGNIGLGGFNYLDGTPYAVVSRMGPIEKKYFEIVSRKEEE